MERKEKSVFDLLRVFESKFASKKLALEYLIICFILFSNLSKLRVTEVLLVFIKAIDSGNYTGLMTDFSNLFGKKDFISHEIEIYHKKAAGFLLDNSYLDETIVKTLTLILTEHLDEAKESIILLLEEYKTFVTSLSPKYFSVLNLFITHLVDMDSSKIIEIGDQNALMNTSILDLKSRGGNSILEFNTYTDDVSKELVLQSLINSKFFHDSSTKTKKHIYKKITFSDQDLLDNFSSEYKNQKFDLVLLNFPIGRRAIRDITRPDGSVQRGGLQLGNQESTWKKWTEQLRDDPNVQNEFEIVLNTNSFFHNRADWMYLITALKILNHKGRVITIVPTGLLSNPSSKLIREKMVAGGYIEAVINLPRNVNKFVSIPLSMLILSFDNSKVKFMSLRESSSPIKDTKHFLKDHFANNQFSKSLLEEKTLTPYNNDIDSPPMGTFVKDVKELSNYYWEISPERILYLEGLEKQEGITLVDALEFPPSKSIFRGVNIPRAEMESMQSNDGNYLYLTLSNIHENQIFLSRTSRFIPKEKNYDRYLLKDGDVLISSRNTIIKSAVFENPNNDLVIASDSLVVIRLDKEKLNPYYFNAFIDHKTDSRFSNLIGLNQNHKQIIINIEELKRLVIPEIPIQQQNTAKELFIEMVDAVNRARELIRLKSLQYEKEIETLFNVSSSIDDVES